jgi:hypothetical protein
MSWFRKQSAKEIARQVKEKTERWERAAEAARLADAIAKRQRRAEGAPLTIWEVAAADLPDSDLAAPFDDQQTKAANREPAINLGATNHSIRQPIPPETLATLLLAGNAMADYFLEERSDDKPPGWCLMCGRRGPNMAAPDSLDHSIGCAVGLWLMSKPK